MWFFEGSIKGFYKKDKCCSCCLGEIFRVNFEVIVIGNDKRVWVSESFFIVCLFFINYLVCVYKNNNWKVK